MTTVNSYLHLKAEKKIKNGAQQANKTNEMLLELSFEIHILLSLARQILEMKKWNMKEKHLDKNSIGNPIVFSS